jgi:hypothetical protein
MTTVFVQRGSVFQNLSYLDTPPFKLPFMRIVNSRVNHTSRCSLYYSEIELSHIRNLLQTSNAKILS